MSERERLKAMIKPRSNDRGSWFVAHFDPGGRLTWHPVFSKFMDLRHRLKADAYPCKYFQYCLLDGFNWADVIPGKPSTWAAWYDCHEELKGVKFSAGDDCEPITAGQYSQDTGPIAEANRAAWLQFIERHHLDKEYLTRAADEMQPGIEYYITHDHFIGLSIQQKQHPEVDEPTPLPVWLAGVVTHEPDPWPLWYRPSGAEMRKKHHEAEIERVTRLNAARGVDNEGRPLKREGDTNPIN